MTDWTAFAERCLAAPKPDESDDEQLNQLCRDLCKETMPRDDYPSVGTRISQAVVLGNINSAVELVEHLFPGWGYQVGRPISARTACGWYASVFRERRHDDKFHPFSGSFGHDAREGDEAHRGTRYANDPALAIMAALCRALAAHEPGTSALAQQSVA